MGKTLHLAYLEDSPTVLNTNIQKMELFSESLIVKDTPVLTIPNPTRLALLRIQIFLW